jgi:hypothetical protein
VILCKIKVKATVDVTVIGTRIVAVSAGSSHRVHRKLVIGEASTTIAGGQTTTLHLSLNATGKRLRRAHRDLPTLVTVTNTVGTGTAVLETKRITLHPVRKKRHKR